MQASLLALRGSHRVASPTPQVSTHLFTTEEGRQASRVDAADTARPLLQPTDDLPDMTAAAPTLQPPPLPPAPPPPPGTSAGAVGLHLPFTAVEQPVTLTPLSVPPALSSPATSAVGGGGVETPPAATGGSKVTAPVKSTPVSCTASPSLRVVRGGRAGGISRKRTTSPRTVARRGALGGGTTSSGGGEKGGGSGAADAVLPRGSVVKITGNNRTKRELLNRQGLVLSAQTLGGWHEVALHDGGHVRVQRNALTLLDAPSAATVAMLPPAAPVDAAVHANIARLDDASLRRYRRHHRLSLPENAGRTELENAVRRHFARTKVNESEVIRGFVRHLHK